MLTYLRGLEAAELIEPINMEALLESGATGGLRAILELPRGFTPHGNS